MNEPHRLLSDTQFEQAFELKSLPAQSFTHEAHLRLAWIHISKYGLTKAIGNVCIQISEYAQSLGVPEKFNMTVTVAAVKAVYHFTNRSQSNDFYELIEEFPRLKTNFKGLVNSHYGFDIFKSGKAKKEFLEPDLVPFD